MRGRGGLLRFQINSYFLSPAFWLGAKEKLLFHLILIQSFCFELPTNMKKPLIQRTFSDLHRKIMVDQIFVFAYLCICCREEFMSSFLIISNIKLLLFSSYMIIGLSCHFSLFLFSMTPNNFNRINNATQPPCFKFYFKQKWYHDYDRDKLVRSFVLSELIYWFVLSCWSIAPWLVKRALSVNNYKQVLSKNG